MGKNLFVGNIAHALSDDELKDTFAECGDVVSAQIIMDRFTGRSKGFGFVEMGSEDGAQKAIAELDGKDVKGRPLRVNEAKPREDRPARDNNRRGGGAGGGRSYDGNR